MEDRKIVFYMESELKKYKISNFESYPYSKSLECPDCEIGSDFAFLDKDKSILVGWTETPQGFMVIKECPVCGCRFRFHSITGDKFDYDRFITNFSLMLHLQEKRNKK